VWLWEEKLGFQNEEEAWRSKMRMRIGARGVHVEEEREKGGKTTITVAQYELIMQQLIVHDPMIVTVMIQQRPFPLFLCDSYFYFFGSSQIGCFFRLHFFSRVGLPVSLFFIYSCAH